MDGLDFLIGLGFAFVLEGLIWGLFPRQIIRVVEELAKQDMQLLRYIGVGSLAIGVFIIWFATSSRVN